ncbi:dethiobiotin synthase [Kaarinaea lacus]
MAGYFITGTDTGVGKTRVSLALMHALQTQEKVVAGMKPVSAGCINTKSGLRNDDATQLQNASSIEIPYNIINPYAYEPAIAPHIAAQEIGDNISINNIVTCYEYISWHADIVIVEGVGGWLAPINKDETMADVAVGLHLPVILVVGMRLGCLSHALLSVEGIKAKNLNLTGWIANHILPTMEKSQDNIDSLRSRITAPLLGVIPYSLNETHKQSAHYLDISQLNK